MDVDLGQLGQPHAHSKDHASDVDEIHIGTGVAEELDDILRRNQNPVFICSSDSRAAAEPFLEEEFKDCLVIELDPDELALDEASRARVMSQLEVCDLGQTSVPVDLLIAVGSSVIHDLTRIAAYEYEVPFASVPTEPDDAMQGQIPVPEIKPRWIYADLQILAADHAGRSEKEERLTQALLACGLERDLFRKQLEDCDEL